MSEVIFPNYEWGYADPVGWPTGLLSTAASAFAEFGVVGTVVVHQGRVILDCGTTDQKVLIRSIRKSFLSALIGIEVERGTIRLDTTMADLGIYDMDGLMEAERQATVRHLLQARSGIYHPALAETKAMTAEKPPRGSQSPGSYWHYNNWDFNALGTIYEQATGHSVFDGVMTDIGARIGMHDFEPSDGAYLRGPQSQHPDAAEFYRHCGWSMIDETKPEPILAKGL